ncbi:MAG TPA: LptF/LptG family permease [Saprospiraceae bacterium]|nr:LptF/LptG family permease [Saprospiraceae bacterium]HMP25807.1 LptF/LptG family permease [Saprospiraceae bacterium]
MVKIIDRLVIKSFVGPFIVTFGIAVFFFLMQTLWFYIDDIAGKGLGFFFVMELLAYKCVSLIPMAMPLAILISSVMVLGGMAEHYELASIKSSGTPLLRVMRPLIVFGIAAALLSYYCSATLIPVANLKFGSRMYDVQQQKPALRLDEGIFNDDFQGFSIHIGKKERDGKTIRDVLIYDHSERSKGQYSQISAREGEMFSSTDGKYFVMNLKNGYQYIEVSPASPGRSGGKYPFVRTSFDQWTKVFDLGEFDLSRTNEELFKSNRTMMSIPELRSAIDSIDVRMYDRRMTFSSQLKSYYAFLETDSTLYTEEPVEDGPIVTDSIATIDVALSLPDTILPVQIDSLFEDSSFISGQHVNQAPPGSFRKKQQQLQRPATNARRLPTVISAQIINKDLNEYEHFAQTFEPVERNKMYDRSKTFILSVQNQAESAERAMRTMRETQVKYSYEMWTKYSIAAVCIIFVFVGAPMGAIVRKGGFGYPILISVIFFMLFVILTIFCRKIADAFVLPPLIAAWVPAAVMLPIGLVLTRKAMNDSSLQISETVTRALTWLAKKRAQA